MVSTCNAAGVGIIVDTILNREFLARSWQGFRSLFSQTVQRFLLGILVLD